MFALLLGACGPTGSGSGDGDGGNSGPTPDAPPNTPTIDANTQDPADADPAACGVQEEEVGLVNLGDPPDMLIVLDRSGSMTQPIDLFNPFGPNRWTVMRDALENIVMSTQNNIRWGLSVFPTDDDCGVSAGTEVSIDIMRYQPIKTWLDGHSANGNTPANAGLEQALTTYAGMTVNPEGRYVLFATDGVPNCDDADPYPLTLAGVTALANAGIHTFVIGYGDPLGFDSTLLNAAAQAGLEPRPGGPPHYYEATNATQLQTALQQISGGVIVPSCSYALQTAPPDPDMVTVKINGTVVPRSTQHTNGWDYYPDSMTITFFGTYCADIEGGAMSSVGFFFGCPGPVID